MLVAYGVDEFTRAAGLDLEVRQSADLAEMLQVHSETGKWRWPEWRMTEHAPNLLAARALFGLLVLNEDVLWTVRLQTALRDTFQRMVHNVDQLGDSGTVKIRRANGEERIERLDTGRRVQFICSRYSGTARGYTADLLILDRSGQHDDLSPTVASRPNPQIVYV